MRGNGILIASIALGVGAAYWWRHRSRAKVVQIPEREHWSMGTRLATGAVGGGLLLYGTRAPGRLSKVAAAAGTAMLMRSLKDEPIHNWSDIVSPRMLLGGQS